MTDRIAYRANLATLALADLVQAGVSIWIEFLRGHRTTAEQNRLWREWDDLVAELSLRRQVPLIEEMLRRVREAQRQPTETAREFLQRSAREMAARQQARPQ